MVGYILRRLLNLIPTFLLATFLAWAAIEAAPGDFATQFTFDQVDPGKAERIRESLGLDQPWFIRYLFWLKNLVLGFDFGTSMLSKGDVTGLVVPRMLNSLVLLLPATLITFALAIPIGVYSAVRKYSLGDRFLTVFSLAGIAIPNFFLGLLVLAFAVAWFQTFGFFLLPTGGMTSEGYSQMSPWGKLQNLGWHLIAPVIVVTLSSLAFTSRVMRGEMLEVLAQDYVRTARAKGLNEGVITYKHALKNALLVLIGTLGSLLPSLVNGAGTIEFVLRWPGITPLFLRSIFAQDVYVIMALITILVLLLMIGNLLADVALALVDPRIRY